MSHVWCVIGIYDSDGPEGPFTSFDASDRRIWGITHYAEIPMPGAHDDLVAALRAVQKLISEAAMTGFNCHDGDWAERLFFSQQATSAALAKATQP